MWTIIICILVLFIVTMLIMYDEDFFFEDTFLHLAVSIFLGFFIGGAIALALPVKTETGKETYNLECIQDNNNVNGGFFLGCGTINGEMKYTFYYKKDDYFKLLQLSYNKVKVKYSEETPKVEYYYTIESKDAFINNFALDWYIGGKEYIIYIPKGSIKQDYNLDAQ